MHSGIAPSNESGFDLIEEISHTYYEVISPVLSSHSQGVSQSSGQIKRRRLLMKGVRACSWISFVVLLLALTAALLFIDPSPAWAQVAPPPSSTISSTSGTLAWDFGPVGGGTVVNEGIQNICPPVMCDDHDLTVVLPAPAATFYQTMTAKLTFKYTWTSTLPTDLDIFAISPNAADHGPGSPDTTSTGPGEEDLTVTDPIDGVWHIRSVASLAPLPTVAHAVVTF